MNKKPQKIEGKVLWTQIYYFYETKSLW